MLNINDLVNLHTIPEVKDISLKLYKEYAVEVLMKRKFCYLLDSGKTQIIQFKDWSFYHMWAIHHINYKITKETLFDEIDFGLVSIDLFKADNKVKKRFLDFKDRLQMFACVYEVLRSVNFSIYLTAY